MKSRLPGKHTAARRELARRLQQLRHEARARRGASAENPPVPARASDEQEFLDGMKPGESPTTALDVLERHAKQPYRTVWLTESWWPQRREALLQLLSERLTDDEATALADFLFNRVGFDVLFAFLAQEQRPDWREFGNRAQAALDKARRDGAWRPLADARILEPGWFFKWQARRRDAA